jgi:hypothetical protein
MLEVWSGFLYILTVFALFCLSHKRVFSIEEGFKIDQVAPALAGDFICSNLKKYIKTNKMTLAAYIEADAVTSASRMVDAIILIQKSLDVHKCND